MRITHPDGRTFNDVPTAEFYRTYQAAGFIQVVDIPALPESDPVANEESAIAPAETAQTSAATKPRKRSAK